MLVLFGKGIFACAVLHHLFFEFGIGTRDSKLSVEINMILEHMYFFSKYFKSVLFYAYD